MGLKGPIYNALFSMDYIGDGDPMHRCVSHTGYLVYEISKAEARGRSRHKNNSRRIARNLEERSVVTKEKSPKQGLISAKD